ncbi:MAG: sigma-70 family RNA polymerase sigma factor [Bacteroidaceae bacterium]|nr:sigma-70 family RNA polymerase sigma factor [Bacteroidaceae bacterium]MBQ2185309.1 sigma-70 family RNA polymerase sigma factor [Bacteroidaceae bacterium]MBQ6049094.1 sigma-70 family RNA polymerase sigma factor [Bacteroidaceae bacterium]MBQ6085186.1 sigma-70 family RNA polymerase sigma factor [Bacteroidaceae bacterium]MBR3547728.1 sigma-70 family RNA polymerase sigma factor [Bacteroidaceae bacterium]
MNNLNTMTDHELVVLYEQGKDQAFDVLLSRYKDYIYSYILFLVRNQDYADDIFQETFTRAIVAIRSHRYQTTGKFNAWLIRIAHNLVIDMARNGDSNNVVSSDDFSKDILNNINLSEGTLESQLIKEQNIKTLNQLLEYLPEPQREVIIMHFYEDLPFREIAEKTGVSINTALGRMRYAIINLRKMIQKHQLSLVG